MKYKIIKNMAIPPKAHRVTPSPLSLAMRALKPNESIHNLSHSQCNNARGYASRYKLKLITRLMDPVKKLYSIWRVS